MTWGPIKTILAILGVYLFILGSVQVVQAEDSDISFRQVKNFNFEEDEEMMGSKKELEERKLYGKSYKNKTKDIGTDEEVYDSEDDMDLEEKPRQKSDDDEFSTQLDNMDKAQKREKFVNGKEPKKAQKAEVKKDDEASPIQVNTNYIDKRIRRDIRIPDVNFDPVNSDTVNEKDDDDPGIASY